jgi:hypothetical protein
MNAGPIDHLFTLQRSPIALAPVIHHFFQLSKPRERDVLLSYLVLPLVLYPPMRKFLLNANVTSSLRTMCDKRERLVGLVERVQQFKPLTHAALLILTTEGSITFTDQMSVNSVGDLRRTNAKPELIKAAKGLAAVCADEQLITVYRMLGLKSL